MLPEEDHLLITSPDRFFGDALTVLFVDWPPALIDQALNSVKASPKRLAIHIYNIEDNNPRWMIDVANQSNIIMINFSQLSQADAFKGYLLPRMTCYYFGRSDLNQIFTNYTDDPIGKLLVLIGEKLKTEE